MLPKIDDQLQNKLTRLRFCRSPALRSALMRCPKKLYSVTKSCTQWHWCLWSNGGGTTRGVLPVSAQRPPDLTVSQICSVIFDHNTHTKEKSFCDSPFGWSTSSFEPSSRQTKSKDQLGSQITLENQLLIIMRRMGPWAVRTVGHCSFGQRFWAMKIICTSHYLDNTVLCNFNLSVLFSVLNWKICTLTFWKHVSKIYETCPRSKCGIWAEAQEALAVLCKESHSADCRIHFLLFPLVTRLGYPR